MAIFQMNDPGYFDQAKWENESTNKTMDRGFESIGDIAHSNQFVLLQLSGGDQRVLNTTQVVPSLTGSSEKPDIKMILDFEGFKIGSNEDIDRRTKATLQLQVGQEQKISGLDKLFYCINGGLDLFDELKGKRSEAKDFKKSTAEALGNKNIELPAGTGEIVLKVMKHEEPKWWQKVFSFAKSDKGRELISLIGFPGIPITAVNCISGMLDNLFDREPEVLFQSMPVKLAFTQAAKTELSGDLSTNMVSCLNPGFWIMARKTDYSMIIGSKPIYYGGYGILAPDGMSEIEAIKDSGNNPFSKITYAIIRARMKEVDLRQSVF